MSKTLKFRQPEIVPFSPGKIPECEKIVLRNGVEVYIINTGTEEITKLDFIFRSGQVVENVPLLASTVNQMLLEGSEKFSAEKLNEEVDYLGAILNNFTEKDRAGLTVVTLNKHIKRILEIVKEVLTSPVFPEVELNALMKKRLQWYRTNREKVQNIAFDLFFESVFSAGHPYGKRYTEDDFSGINVNLLHEFHRRFYRFPDMTIIASGKIHPETLELIQDFFGAPAPGNDQLVHYELPPVTKPSQQRIKKNGALQAAIRIGSQTIGKRDSDYHDLKILDTILGGYFGSRLMKNLREEKGLTYGISSTVYSYELMAYKLIHTEANADYTGLIIDEIFKEIKNLQDSKIVKDELDLVRRYMLGEMIRMFDGPFALADTLRSVWEFGLDFSYYNKMADRIKSITPYEIMNIANTYYRSEDLHIVIVGPE